MRYVNCARNEEEQNLIAFQHKGGILYRSCGLVTSGAELLVWYGDEYARHLGIGFDRLWNNKSSTKGGRSQLTPAQAFPCPECPYSYTSQIFLHKHMKRSHGDLYGRLLRSGEIKVEPSLLPYVAASYQEPIGASPGTVQSTSQIPAEGAGQHRSLQKGQYRLVGKMIALCLVQGQVSPRFLSQRLYRQVCKLSPLPATLEEVTDYNLRTKLQKIADATHVEGAREAMEEATDELSLMGSFSFVRSLPHRDELLGAALNFLTEGRILTALNQFKEGLETFGILALLRIHHEELKGVFMDTPEPLLASRLESTFMTSYLSEPGSNRRRKEARTLIYWRDWLIEVEDGDTSLTLGAVLAFATGLKRIPAVGFPIGPRLEFLHEEDGPALFPTANTCSLVLRLPVYLEYNRFKEAMEEGITSCGSTFGVA
ncbi:G2/M phase-specific E3 ubiquitin-protein ligase-like [Gadus chalcogrammus]|uniref:G2/M phase-specific E3 ubiquitin-protein ligase-like n=1 Tax=Gadus chalcogrammus TaxID=1042646 RepID=UPI0024C47A3C|nr:G2/M phase-specific E3 ubiquitin-protein ligase-like [Gadus chalcogrammus]